jgi:hypothetical protein
MGGGADAPLWARVQSCPGRQIFERFTGVERFTGAAARYIRDYGDGITVTVYSTF